MIILSSFIQSRNQFPCVLIICPRLCEPARSPGPPEPHLFQRSNLKIYPQKLIFYNQSAGVTFMQMLQSKTITSLTDKKDI